MLKARVVGEQEVIAKLHHMKRSLLTRKIMGAVAAKAVTIIKVRTEKGLDVNGSRFAPYSSKPAYIKSSNKKHSRFYPGGYREFKATRGGGWLHDSGRMMSALQHRVFGRDRAVIRFTRTQEAIKAHGHNTGGGKLPKRNFFGLGSDGRKQLSKILKDELKNAIST